MQLPCMIVAISLLWANRKMVASPLWQTQLIAVKCYFISQFNYIQFENTLHQKLIYLINNILICLYNIAIGQFRMHVIFIFKIIH